MDILMKEGVLGLLFMLLRISFDMLRKWQKIGSIYIYQYV